MTAPLLNSFIVAPGGDPSFASVVLLLGFEGVDAAVTTTDEAPSPHTMIFAGNAQIDTAEKKFGSSSLLLDGTGDNVGSADSADWDFGTADFTVEGWWRFARNTNTEVILGHYKASAGNRDWGIFVDLAATIRFVIDGPTTRMTSSGWSATLGNWYHIAIDRSGTTYRLYVDGVMVATASATDTISSNNGALQIGASENSGGSAENFFQGHIDELRITKGVSRYGAVYGDTGFTPPVAAFPRS